MACVERKVNSVLLAVRNLLFTGIHGPNVRHSPWSDDLKIRGKSLDAKLETNLVISFSCSPMTDGAGAFFSCDLNQFLGDRGTRHGSTQEILVLVYSVCLYARNNIVVAEIIDNIFYV